VGFGLLIRLYRFSVVAKFRREMVRNWALCGCAFVPRKFGTHFLHATKIIGQLD